MAVKLTLYLARHGSSMSNEGLTAGLPDELRGDPPLSKKGERQAELLGGYLSGLRLDAVLSSPLRRAVQTANAVVLRQPADGAKTFGVYPVFTECGTGEDTLPRTPAQICAEIPAAMPGEGVPPDENCVYYSAGDDDAALLERGKKAMAMIEARFHSGETVLVAAHGAFNTFLLYAALGLSHEQIFDPAFHNTGLTRLDFYETGTGPFGDVHLLYHNAVPHLVEEFPEFRY